jgi:hypothetical protein
LPCFGQQQDRHPRRPKTTIRALPFGPQRQTNINKRGIRQIGQIIADLIKLPLLTLEPHPARLQRRKQQAAHPIPVTLASNANAFILSTHHDTPARFISISVQRPVFKIVWHNSADTGLPKIFFPPMIRSIQKST